MTWYKKCNTEIGIDGQQLSLTGDQLSISNGNTLTLNSAQIYVKSLAGGSSNGLNTGSWARNSTVNRTAAGRWSVVFNSPHPDGIEYEISFSTEEPATTRDQPKITVNQTTKTNLGFTFALTVDDNGGAADTYSDQPWTYSVSTPITVLIP